MIATSGVRLQRAEDDLGSVRAHIESLLTQGRTDEALDLLFELLARFREDNDHLRVRLQSALRRLFGRSSERVGAADLQGVLSGVLDASETTTAPTTAASETAEAPAATAASETAEPPPAVPEGGAPSSGGEDKPRTARPHGRGELPKGLPVERRRRPLSPEERVCPCCQGDVKVFDTDESWSIDYRPGSLVVMVYECEKGACPRCADGGVVQAEAPAKPIPGGQPGAGLLARLIVDKAEDALPLARQVTRLGREGLTVAETTVQGWWDAALDRLEPLADRLLDAVLAEPVVQLDGTRLPVLDRDHPKGLRKGTVWPVVAPAVGVVFTYEPDRSDGLKAIFDRVATLTTPKDDGTPPRVVIPPRFVVDGEGALASRIAKAGLWPFQLSGMHARRKFKQALDAGDTRAAIALGLFRKLYDVERTATEQDLPPTARQALRDRASVPVLEELRVWALELQPKVAPRTPLGKALGYLAPRWLNLCVFVNDGRIPLDTGEVERRIRRLAVGRNNYLFAGSDTGARRLAVALSLCGTCRLLGIEPWAYLRDVITAIAEGAEGAALDALLPAAWLQKQTEKAQKPESCGS